MDKKTHLEFLKRDLRQREREKARLWESFWWILWIFLPVVGWIIMIIIAIQKANRTAHLENDCNDLRDRIRELENELMKEKIENKL